MLFGSFRGSTALAPDGVPVIGWPAVPAVVAPEGGCATVSGLPSSTGGAFCVSVLLQPKSAITASPTMIQLFHLRMRCLLKVGITSAAVPRRARGHRPQERRVAA